MFARQKHVFQLMLYGLAIARLCGHVVENLFEIQQ